MKHARDWWPSLVLFAMVVGVWQLWVSARGVQAYVVPTPMRVLRAGVDARHLLVDPTLTTVSEALMGLAVGAGLGLAIALTIVRFDLLRRALYPVLVVSQTIPPYVLAPLLVLWFGYTRTPRVVVVVLWSFFPVLVSTVGAIDGVDRELVDLVRSMGASTRQLLREVVVPAALPGFFAGLRIAATYAVGGAVVAELVGGSSGLGVFINAARRSYQVDRVFVAVVLVAALTAALFVLVDLAGRLAVPWQASGRTERLDLRPAKEPR